MAVDMFLKLEGIKGESKKDGHKDEIDIYSYSWGLSQTGTFGTGGGGGAGKVNVHDITVTKQCDKSTCSLMLHCCQGKHIKSGVVTVRKAAGDKALEYYVIKLTDILVSAYNVTGSGGDSLHETLSINFNKFEIKYQEQKPDGSGVAGGDMSWDVGMGKK